jgi:hypothetical protein
MVSFWRYQLGLEYEIKASEKEGAYATISGHQSVPFLTGHYDEKFAI